jgi:uncharacterized protein (TIGR02246 family)
MKRGAIAFSLITLLSREALAQTSNAQKHPDDETAIKRVIATYDEYWNRHEFARTAELRTDDSENVNVLGLRETRADIAKGGPPYYQQLFGNSTLHNTVISIKFIKSDVAAVDSSWEMTGMKCPDGSDVSYRKGLMSLVMTKDRGRWLIAVFHNLDLPAPADRGGQRNAPCQFR